MRGRWKVGLLAIVLVTAAVAALVLLRPEAEGAGARVAMASFRLTVGPDGPERPERWEVRQGQPVYIRVRLGYESIVHLHGYDVVDSTGPGHPPAEIRFVADTPGRFNLEAHTGWNTLAQITVSP